jgi:hypothetical protein
MKPTRMLTRLKLWGQGRAFVAAFSVAMSFAASVAAFLAASMTITLVASSFAWAGPGSGAGKLNLEPDLALSSSDITSLIDSARKLVPFVLNYYEGVIVNARAIGSAKVLHETDPLSGKVGALTIPNSVYKAFFPWPSAGLDAMAKWQTLVLVAKSDCHNESGKKVAASGFPIESNEVCYDPAMLANVLVRSNALPRLTGLLMHELLHKMKIDDEDLADKIEFEVESSLQSDSVQVMQASLNAINNESLKLGQAIDATLQHLNRYERAQEILRNKAITASYSQAANDAFSSACVRLGSVQTLGERLGATSDDLQYPMRALRPIDRAEVLATRRRSTVLNLYCEELSPAEVAAQIKAQMEPFKPKATQQAIYRANSNKFQDSGILSMTRGTWRAPEYKNVDRLIAELNDMRKSTEIVYQRTLRAKGEKK